MKLLVTGIFVFAVVAGAIAVISPQGVDSRVGMLRTWEMARKAKVPESSEVNKRGRPSKWPPEGLPSKFADFDCAFSLQLLGENMTPKDPFLEGTF